MEGPERFGAKGVNGTLVVTPERIMIRRKRAVLVLLGQGFSRSKEIAVDQIVGTQFKKATTFINGYIRFSLAGGTETKGGGFDAAQDENAIMFTDKQQPAFARAKELIDLYGEAARDAERLVAGDARARGNLSSGYRLSSVKVDSTATASSSRSMPMFAATMRSVVSWQAARAASSRSPEQGTSPSPPTAGCAPQRKAAAGTDSAATTQCTGSASSGLHRRPHRATISTVCDGHVGKIVGKQAGRLTFRPRSVRYERRPAALAGGGPLCETRGRARTPKSGPLRMCGRPHRGPRGAARLTSQAHPP
jgi:hypothetical protein